MNYSECLQLLIKACPEKERSTNDNIIWFEAERARDNIIAQFDSEILNMVNIALQDIKASSDYMLITSTRFGTRVIIDKQADLLTPYVSYYLRTGIIYGTTNEKKSQFNFEIVASADKNGVEIRNDIGKRESRGDTGKAFEVIKKTLSEFYSR